MKNILSATIIGLMALSLSSATIAEVFGKRYLSLDAGTIWLGDGELSDFADNMFIYGANIRLPIIRQWDFVAKMSRAEADGSHTTCKVPGYCVPVTGSYERSRVDGIGYFSFSPESDLNPFMGLGVIYGKNSHEASFVNPSTLQTGVNVDNNEDWGYTGAIGIELNFETDKTIIFEAHAERIFDESETRLASQAIKWFSKRLFVEAKGQYEIESKNIYGALGLGVAF